jgi:uncharacterized membrane protein YjgN (DUF898 family)
VNKVGATGQSRPRHFDFEFNGQAGDFFGIWFVNAFLTLLTLGLYSPWAKVRTQQYFYGNTSLAGGSFQFLANPVDLFKTRLIAFGLLILFVVSDNYTGVYQTAAVIYIAMIVVYLAIAPILLVMLMSFRLRYSAWRGIAFRFNKDFVGAYRVYLAPAAMFALVILSVAAPFYLFDESSTGADTEAAGIKQDYTAQYPPESDLSRRMDSVDGAGASDGECGLINNASEEYVGVGSRDGGVESNEGCDSEPGSLSGSIEAFHFLPALIFALIFAALLPYFDFINNRFLARNARFGTARVKFLASAKDYYMVYGAWLAGTATVAMLWVGAIDMASSTSAGGNGVDKPSGGSVMTWMLVITILYVFLSKAYLRSRRYNLLAGNLEIGDGHRILANTTFLGYLWLMISNTAGYFLSLGLLKAWVMVRTARYLLNCTSLRANGSVEEFTAAERQSVNSLAEETADVFDLNLA